MTEGSETPLTILRCKRCGDTFPSHEGEVILCPSCGNDATDEAREPLL